MAERIRLDVIGANARAHLAARSHMPALLAGRDFESTAVCTTRGASDTGAEVSAS